MDCKKGHQARRESNCLVKHEKEAHSGNKQEYSAGFIGRQRGLLYLPLIEALLIEGQVAGTSLNHRKKEAEVLGSFR